MHIWRAAGPAFRRTCRAAFAAFATLLGMQWLAAALYFDAVLSASGTTIAYIGATARINYALAQNEQFPSLFLHLNRASVPVWALIFNFVLGFLLFPPFPAERSSSGL